MKYALSQTLYVGLHLSLVVTIPPNPQVSSATCSQMIMSLLCSFTIGLISFYRQTQQVFLGFSTTLYPAARHIEAAASLACQFPSARMTPQFLGGMSISA